MENEFMTVGELARLMGVTVRTLQYYDKKGLLKPASMSEGGRRLYCPKDMVKLHQILAFKYLGFSLDEIKKRIWNLDTPKDAAILLEQQKKAIEEQILELEEALKAVEALHTEVLEMKTVDFKKYAEIIELLKMGNQQYWVWKLMDDTLAEHIKNRYSHHQDLGNELLYNYMNVIDEALLFKRQKEAPDSEKSLALAKKFWDLIMEFTGGDMSLLPRLMDFNLDKTGWKEELAAKQKEADDFIGEALGYYFKQSNIVIPEMEQTL